MAKRKTKAPATAPATDRAPEASHNTAEELEAARALTVPIKPSPRALLVKRLLAHIPRNEYGLPICIYRPDLLPEPDENGEVIRAPEPFKPEPEPSNEGTDDVRTDADSASELHLGAEFEASYSYNAGEMDEDAAFRALFGDEPEEPKKKYRPLKLLPTSPDGGGMQLMHIPEIKGTLPTSEELNVAQVDLHYDEAFPTLPSALPFWCAFEWEEPLAFKALEVYLQQPHTGSQGVRRLVDVPTALGAMGIQCTLVQVKDWYYLHYWQWRAKAYDIYRHAQYELAQQERGRLVDQLQYARAEKLMNRLMTYMEDEDEFWGLMTPIAAINMFKELRAAQRIAAGLPAASPQELGRSGSQGQGRGVLQTEATQETAFARRADGRATQVVEEETELLAMEDILNDPDAFEAVQGLVFKLMERPHHKEKQASVLAAPQIVNDDPDQAVES